MDSPGNKALKVEKTSVWRSRGGDGAQIDGGGGEGGGGVHERVFQRLMKIKIEKEANSARGG
jgi:hypothetical protein